MVKHKKGYTKSLTDVHSFTGTHYGTFTSQPTSMMQVIAENWKKKKVNETAAILRIAWLLVDPPLTRTTK